MKAVQSQLNHLVENLGPATPLLHAQAFLHIAASRKGTTGNDIAKATDQNATRITRVVQALAESALVKAESAHTDRRKQRFVLTPRGEAVVEKLGV